MICKIYIEIFLSPIKVNTQMLNGFLEFFFYFCFWLNLHRLGVCVWHNFGFLVKRVTSVCVHRRRRTVVRKRNIQENDIRIKENKYVHLREMTERVDATQMELMFDVYRKSKLVFISPKNISFKNTFSLSLLCLSVLFCYCRLSLTIMSVSHWFSIKKKSSLHFVCVCVYNLENLEKRFGQIEKMAMSRICMQFLWDLKRLGRKKRCVCVYL